MKVVNQPLASTVFPFLGLLVAHNTLFAAEAASETMTVGASGVSFSIERYDDGRDKPYTVTFTEDSGQSQSIYTFDAAGFVTDVVVGPEEYEVLYESNGGDLSEVRLTSTGRRRALLLADAERQDAEGEEGGGGGGAGAADGMLVGGGGQSELASRTGQRRLYACDDCVEAWDAVCDDGVPSVCDLVDYGSPILPAAEASIATMCEVMGRACSNSGGTEACAGQCGDDDGGDDDGGDDGDDKGALC